jgi:hypothetical protein
MRSRHSARCPHEPDFLAARNRITFRYQRTTQVKISGDDSVAVIDVDDVPGQEESIDERDDSTVGCNDRRSCTSSQIHTEVARGERSVECAAGTESRGNG